MEELFSNIPLNTCKDSFFFACKSLLLSKYSDELVVAGSNDRFSVHVSLILDMAAAAGSTHTDDCLSKWIMNGGADRAFTIWYLSLLKSQELAGQVLGTMLAETKDAKSRRSLIYAAEDAAINHTIIALSADIALSKLGCVEAADLLATALPAPAISHVNSHAQQIAIKAENWIQAASELGSFFSQLPGECLSPQYLDDLASEREDLVAQIATFMHLSRLALLLKEYRHVKDAPPSDALKLEFGAAAKFAERSQQAWLYRLQSAAEAFCQCCEELLSEDSAWNDQSVADEPFMWELRASYAPALRETLASVNCDRTTK
jgi:hypothetical protein